MKLRMLIAVAVPMLVGAVPANATMQTIPLVRVTGEEFFNRCTNPPLDGGEEVVALCEMYVAGIADGLQADGRACVDTQFRQGRPFPVALIWIRNHMNYGHRSASFMIKNAIEYGFPCRVTNVAARRPMITEQQIASFGRFVQFLATAKKLLLLFGMT